MKLHMFLGAALVAGIGLATVQTVSAGNDRDCKSLKKWNSDKTYSKGDRVWYPEGGMNSGAEYKCDQSECRGVKDQPYYGSGKAWAVVGSCTSEPK